MIACTKSLNSSEHPPILGKKRAKHAVEKAGKSLRDLRIAEVATLDMKVDDNKVTAYRARIKVSFKYED